MAGAVDTTSITRSRIQMNVLVDVCRHINLFIHLNTTAKRCKREREREHTKTKTIGKMGKTNKTTLSSEHRNMNAREILNGLLGPNSLTPSPKKKKRSQGRVQARA
jgi:hypothetical protein